MHVFVNICLFCDTSPMAIYKLKRWQPTTAAFHCVVHSAFALLVVPLASAAVVVTPALAEIQQHKGATVG